MKSRAPLVSIGLWFCLLSSFPLAHAQQNVTVPSGTSTQTTPPVAPEQKAYDEARRIKDPQKKIDALEKVIKDYPEHFYANQARTDVLDTLIRSFPDQKDKIHAAAERILAPTRGVVFSPGFTYLNVASKLMEAGMFLEWAEELARKGSAQYEEETAKSMRRQRARYQDALGRIYLKQGKTKEAQKYLKQALSNEPELTTALIAMGQIAEKSGDHKKAVEFLSSAAIKFPLKKADRQLMETAYRAAHHDSLNGLEEMLDDKYRKLNASLRFDHYQATPKRSNRTALAELFTGSGCGPCVAADLGFDGLLERYNRQDLVVLVYHLHVPLPDPMTNPATVERGKYYAVPSFHSRAFAVLIVAPWVSLTRCMTCGAMICPLLATPAATSAICKGVADVSPWPIDARAIGPLPWFAGNSVGKRDAAGAGRSIGGRWLNPNFSAPSTMRAAPTVLSPISANALLHDTRRMSKSGPPQASPPKLERSSSVKSMS